MGINTMLLQKAKSIRIQQAEQLDIATLIDIIKDKSPRGYVVTLSMVQNERKIVDKAVSKVRKVRKIKVVNKDELHKLSIN